MAINAYVELDDERLVLACRQGSEEAWETLVERYQRFVYSIPRRAGLDSELAAEVFQQVFTTLCEHLNRIEQPGRIKAWLGTTARRESWRLNRQARATSPLPHFSDEEEDGVADIPDESFLPEDVLMQMEIQDHVRTAIDTLDERSRTLMVLLFYQPEPMSYAEIADHLGVSEGSIGPTRARCLQKLRKALNGVMIS
ncbi:MAG: sigma-70 family RNA polymerase sigma factor [Chloroflexota bacterium]